MAGHKFDTSTKGRYVVVTENGTIARRQLGFCDGVLLSDGFIKPGELVALSILETQPGWSGDLRIGLTLLPNNVLQPLPSFALPELVSRGQSWVVPVGTAAALLVSHRHRVYWKRQRQLRRSTRRLGDGASVESTITVMDAGSCCASLLSPPENPIPLQLSQSSSSSPCSCCLHTAFGRVPIRNLMPCEPFSLRAPDVEKGSVVAIYYELEPLLPTASDQVVEFNWPLSEVDTDQTTEIARSSPLLQPDYRLYKFRFHIVINGVDLITVTENLHFPISHFDEHVHGEVPLGSSGEASLKSQDLMNSGSQFPRFRAVFDVYGQTKAIQLISLNQTLVATLSRLCYCAIVNRIIQLHYRGVCNDTHPEKPADFVNNVDKLIVATPPPEYSASRLAHLTSNAPDNVRLQHLIHALDSLPLPQSDRHRLQADVHAVIVRELEGALASSC